MKKNSVSRSPKAIRLITSMRLLMPSSVPVCIGHRTRARMPRVPTAVQLRLHQLDRQPRLVRLQDLVEPNLLGLPQLSRVAQQQPMSLLDDAQRRSIVKQLLCAMTDDREAPVAGRPASSTSEARRAEPREASPSARSAFQPPRTVVGSSGCAAGTSSPDAADAHTEGRQHAAAAPRAKWPTRASANRESAEEHARGPERSPDRDRRSAETRADPPPGRCRPGLRRPSGPRCGSSAGTAGWDPPLA